ncbi:MAG: DUF932 domain-containing protein [Syntrophaceae bacterium]|nr:DUF932 domain-containing protein [Syntrophaceae bacterium]
MYIYLSEQSIEHFTMHTGYRLHREKGILLPYGGKGGEVMPAEATFPEVVEQPVMWGYHRDLHHADKYKALINPDTGKLFSIVTKDYRLIRHEEVIDRVEAAILKNHELTRCQISTDFYNDCGRMRRTYRFPGISVEIDKDDPVNLELHLFNSYDVSWPFIVLLGVFRFVCSNGLVVGKKFMQVRKRHVFGLEKIELEHEISTALKRFRKQAEEWQKWVERLLTEASYNQVMEAMRFGKRAEEQIGVKLNRESTDYDDRGFPIITLWAFFNVLTWFITFKTTSLNHRVEMERRLREAVAHFKA